MCANDLTCILLFFFTRTLSFRSAEPFQFVEIGYARGNGFRTYTAFLPKGELHSFEKNPEYGNDKKLLEAHRLHLGDASDYDHLHSVWTTHMRRPDAPPLKVVVDDASHQSPHMVASVFFWFPRIEPGGVLIVEDIQPYRDMHAFRTEFMPQIMNDLHFCGNPKFTQLDVLNFPTLHPFLASIQCEMHICAFERNDAPAQELSREESRPPPHALDAKLKKTA